MKKIFEYLSEHGTMLMMAGFGLAVVGVFVYWRTRFYGNYIPQVAFGVTIAGFVIYVTGRIFVAISRNRSGKNSITE